MLSGVRMCCTRDMTDRHWPESCRWHVFDIKGNVSLFRGFVSNLGMKACKES